MAIVITNGMHYVTYEDTGKIEKSKDINKAFQFSSISDAIKGMKKDKQKTQGYYVFDTFTKRVLWKWMSQEEIVQMQEEKSQIAVKRKNSGKIRRKQYSQTTRKIIYMKADGRCELCGRKILLEDMTIDHMKPLSMGGIDDVENLACTCYACNLFKGNILPSDFMERITEIFMYQTNKRLGNGFKWKMIQALVKT